MRRSPAVTKARVPHVALVLLPAALLAAVGVRAVTAEMRASEDAARERARSVASRLARSVDALVAEYAGALPKPGTSLTRAQAKEMTAHLRPRRALTLDGVSLALDNDLPPDPGPIPEDEASLMSDALQRAAALSGEPNGVIAASALENATAQIVRHPVAKAHLLFAALERDGAEVDDGALYERLREAETFGAYRRGPDGVPFDIRALRLVRPGFGRRTAAAPLVREIVERVAEDPWGISDEVRMTAFGDPRIGWPLDDSYGLGAWNAARLLARDCRGGSAPPTATLVAGPPGNPTLTVWTTATVDGQPTLLGGDVPPGAFEERVARESHVLRTEGRARDLILVPPEGEPLFAGFGDWQHANAVVVETVPLAEPLSYWRAEAVVARDTGVPPTAWLLGAAVLVTTAALVAGLLALRRSAERSARLAEDRQTFLDHVAHELRTPAAAVQALTEELASGHVTKEREPQYREHLLRESRRLSALVEDTLDLTRLDAGRLAFRMEPADLRDVVRRAVEESDGAGRVTASLPDAPVVRAVDEGTLRRAVRNLVENALRHGGSDAPVSVTLEARDGAASVTVADQGRGIAPEHQARLFERFYRVPSATHEVKGVGLGLALCREVARAHGGDVTVASEVGKGATFTLRIPLA